MENPETSFAVTEVVRHPITFSRHSVFSLILRKAFGEALPRNQFARAVLFAAILFCVPALTNAQSSIENLPAARPQSEADQPTRSLDLDILIRSQPAYRVKAQAWGRILQELDYTAQFRLPKPGEETLVEDLDQDGRLTVHVVCGMSSDGSLQVGNRKFTMADSKELKLFLEEVILYGAGGPPDQNSRWGMTDEQLFELTRMLSEPVTSDVEIQSPLVTVESIGLPSAIRMRFTEAARGIVLRRPPESAPEMMDLKGFSKGTAVAIVLAQYHLGFRPHRIAAGSYEIEIDAGDESANLWPIGWRAQESSAIILPAYLKSIPVDVEDAAVSSLLDVICSRLEVPAYRSTFALAAEGKDLDELTYTRKNDKVSPSRLLTAIGDKLQLGFDLRVDEAGKIFLWVTTSEESTAFRTRFAHVRQK